VDADRRTVSGGREGWYVAAANFDTVPFSLTVYVICAKG
jgi:hypothetical protein